MFRKYPLLRNKTYYEILSVPRTANDEEIKAAYHQKMRENHPDHNPTLDATVATQEIVTAYEILKDNALREEYDRENPAEEKRSHPVGVPSTPVHISELKTLSSSDEKIIQFINGHIENEEALTVYFSTLTTPLSASILTMKLPWHVDGDDGEEEYNFLGYAGKEGKKYFKHLIRLATPEAIDIALSEDPINPRSATTLHAILFKQAEYKKEGVIELIQKASADIISAVLIKQYQGQTPFFSALR